MPDTPPNPPAIPPADESPTSADVVTGKWPKVIKALETRISVLEDSNKSKDAKLTEYETKLAVLANTPSKVPGKSILQELDDWVFGPKTPKA